jgi:hypothetical protein
MPPIVRCSDMRAADVRMRVEHLDRWKPLWSIVGSPGVGLSTCLRLARRLNGESWARAYGTRLVQCSNIKGMMVCPSSGSGEVGRIRVSLEQIILYPCVPGSRRYS